VTPRQVRDEVLTLLLAATKPPLMRWRGRGTCFRKTPKPSKSSIARLPACSAGARPAVSTCPTAVHPDGGRRIDAALSTGVGNSRRAIGDDEIGGYRVPGKTNIIICSFVTHRHPAFWEEPQRFDPSASRPSAPRSVRTSPICRSAAARESVSEHLRDHRGATGRCDDRSALSAAARARPSGGTASADHAASASRDADDAVSGKRRRRRHPTCRPRAR